MALDVGQRTILKSLREKRKLGPGRMAEMIGVSRSYYWHMEQGSRDGSAELWTKIATALRRQMREDDVRLEELILNRRTRRAS